MTWVKICGMTNLEDALTAVDAGADAVGFVFHPHSPRNIDAAIAAGIVKKLPPETEKVGIFVGDRIGGVETKRRIARQARLTAIQAYNSTSLRSLAELQSVTDRLFIAWPAERFINGRLGGFRWRSEAKDKISAILLDSGTGRRPGGTGRAFDWGKTAGVLSSLKEFRFIIAGGMTVENVDEALGVLHPWGIDVSSGVEARPGKKDPDKVRAFVKAVRDYDRKVS